MREGKHGARSTKQAIMIGLAKARRAGSEAACDRRSFEGNTEASGARYQEGTEQDKEVSQTLTRSSEGAQG